MEKSKTIKSVSFVIAGALLQVFYGVGSGWGTSIISIFGLIIFLIGLKQLKDGLDGNGAGAVSLLIIAAIIGIIASVLGMIPIIGLVAIILFIVAFVIELLGFLKLKTSETIGATGKAGAGLLVISMILSLLAGILGIIPVVGSIIATILAIVSLYFMFTGWVKVQNGLIGDINAVNAVTQILIGTLLMLSNSATSGWGAAIVSLLGLILLIRGFNLLKSEVDETGKKAIGMLIIAVYVGILASVLDVVLSLMNIGKGILQQSNGTFETVVMLAFAAAFVIQFLGYMQLKGSASISEEGKKGVLFLMISMICGAVANLGGFVSFGGILTTILSVVAIALVFFGWVKIQGGLLEKK